MSRRPGGTRWLVLLSALAAIAPQVHAQDQASTANDLVFNSVSSPDTPEPRPVFEAGIAAGVATVPDYPAADQNHVRSLPTPYFILRGNTFRSDDGGTRARMLRTERISFEFSGDAAFNTRSKDNHARMGMKDLDYLGELGPQVRILLDEFGPGRKLNLLLPVRGAFTTNLERFNYRGIVFAPEISYIDRRFLGAKNTVGLAAGSVFASGALMRYYYDVTPGDVTPDRPEFHTHGGYLGSHLSAFAGRRLTPAWSVGVFAGLDINAGSTAHDSPLYRDDFNYSFGIGAAWSFYLSQRTTSDLD